MCQFLSQTINKFLGVEKTNIPELEVIDNQVSKEITFNQVKVWPKKKKISFGKLFVKYVILNRTAEANWRLVGVGDPVCGVSLYAAWFVLP